MASAPAAVPRFWPDRRDPRIPFAAVLTLYAVLGFSFLGFNRSPVQMGALVAAACALDLLLTRWLRGQWVLPLSAYISGCSLALLLNYSHSTWLLVVPVYLAIASKHLITFQGRHVYNPSLFGVVVSLLVTGELVTAAPAYQWAGGDVTMAAFVVMAALALFVFRVRRGALIVSFLLLYAAQTALRAYVMRHHLPWQTLFYGTLGAPPFLLFVFYMMTDPATSPKTAKGQVALAFAVTVIDLYLHTKASVFTYWYAAFICQTSKLVFLHGRELWRSRGRALLQNRWPELGRRFAAIALPGLLIGAVATAASIRGAGHRSLAFHLDRVPASAAGLSSKPSDLLERVDPRIQHVAKWILSVGDAVAVGDYDSDGRPDLFLTNPLKQDRGALYRNLGDLRFERVPLPALAERLERYADFGLPSAAAFVDYDGDGDEDLAVGFSFSPSRLLKNLRAETGEATFADVTEAAGLSGNTICLAMSFFDFDRDGHLDLLVANAAAPYLPDYATPTPLNAFRLPQPAYPGDRRMFHFMHNGWHDADNGGLNVLYRGRGDGTFERLDSVAMGLPDTRWSLAIGTADFNSDGWTDLYIANDFGPDDLYLNEGGRHFRHILGPRFGDIGRDTYKGMNVSIADFDRNGWPDVYVSNVHHALQAEGSLLWMTRPSKDPFIPRFDDEATQRGALNERRFGWGAAAGDLDDDGWMDLVQANGMVDDRLDPRYERDKDYWYVNHKLMQAGPEFHTYADRWGDLRGRTIFPNEARRLYLNQGASGQPGQFVDVAKEAGVDDPDNSRGVTLADLDGDGDLDAVITNQHGEVSLYRNTLRPNAERHWIALDLEGNGTSTARAAIGTVVVLRYAENGQTVEQRQEVGVMGGFSGQADRRLHFGLGAHAGSVTVEIRWYGGATETLTLEPDRLHPLRQPLQAAQRTNARGVGTLPTFSPLRSDPWHPR